jgi:hypothetical protein
VTITPLEPPADLVSGVSGSVSGPVSGVSAVSAVSAAPKETKGWHKKHGFLQRLLNKHD